jgi:hypothetical protein
MRHLLIQKVHQSININTRGAATKKGFGSGGGKSTGSNKKAFVQDGVVRIDNVLSCELADELRSFDAMMHSIFFI